MTPPDAGQLVFLSWYRTGLAAGVVSASDPLALHPSPRAATHVRVELGDATETGRVEVSFDIQGPADVGGLDPAQVVRTWPPGEATAVVTDTFPMIEFTHPGLPWLFSPSGPALGTDPATTRRGLPPWLCLVVVRDDAAVLDTPPEGLPRISVSTAELPDLAESHLWAHTQVTTVGGADVDHVLSADPRRGLSRLIAARRLLPATSYLACVVPTFDVGVTAGLTGAVPTVLPGTAGPAWPTPLPSPATTVTLPVYVSWRFTTGADGDFLSLLRRLRAGAVSGLGFRPLDVGHAGGGVAEAPGGQQWTIDLEGVLTDAAKHPGTWPDSDVRQTVRSTLATALVSRGQALTAPLYGSAQTPGDRSAPDPASSGWRSTLNLDPRYRAAAALGASLVRADQQALVLSAWEEMSELADVNRVLARGHLASALASSTFDRRIGGSSAAVLSDADLLGVTAGVHPRVDAPAAAVHVAPPGAREPADGDPRSGDAAVPPSTIADRLGVNPSLVAVTSAPFRRATRRGGPLSRRLASVIVPPPVTEVAASSDGGIVALPPLAPVPGLVDLAGLSGGAESLRGITGARVNDSSLSWETPAAPAVAVPGDGVAAVAPAAVQGAAAPGFLADLLILGDAGDTIGRALGWEGNALAGWHPAQLGSGRADLQLRRTDSSDPTGRRRDPAPLRGGDAALVTYYGAVDSPVLAAIQFTAYNQELVGDQGATSYVWLCSIDLVLYGDILPGNGQSPVSAPRGPDGNVNRPTVQLYKNAIYSPPGSGPTWLQLAGVIAAGPTAGYNDPTIVTIHQVSGGDLMVQLRRPDATALETVNRQWPRQMGTPRSAALTDTALYVLIDRTLWGAHITGPTPVAAPTRVDSFDAAAPAGWTGAVLTAADFTGRGHADLMVVFTLPTTDATGAAVSRTIGRIGFDLTGVSPYWSDRAEMDAALDASTGCAVIGNVDSSSAELRALVSQAFRAPATQVQSRLAAVVPPTPAGPPPTVVLAPLAGGLRTALDPSSTIPTAITTRLRNAPLDHPSEATLQPLRAPVTFPRALSTRLEQLALDRFIPGIRAFPDESLTLLRADSAVVESIMVGANHEMSRELLWNRVPADRSQTYFRQFWTSLDPDTGLPVPDIDPIADWAPESALGSHSTTTATAGAVLLIRGEFVRRFPHALISASPAVAAPAGSPASAVRMPDLAARVDPLFAGTIGADCLFVGFPFTPEDALGTSGHLGMYIVFEEHAAALRFGLDEPPHPPVHFGQAPTQWRRLDWSATVPDADHYDALTYLDTGAGSPLHALALTDTGAGVAHHWGFSAAHMAHATMHTPVRVARHAATLLTPSTRQAP